MVEMYSTISKNNNPLSKNKSRVKIGTTSLVKKDCRNYSHNATVFIFI